jgi:hypothetical protein
VEAPADVWASEPARIDVKNRIAAFTSILRARANWRGSMRHGPECNRPIGNSWFGATIGATSCEFPLQPS